MRGRIARATLALLAGALIFGPSAAQAGNQLFEGSWTVKAFGNERTDGTGASEFYSAWAIPQGILCNPFQPRCPFVSTPTDGAGNFHPLGGSLTVGRYCAPWYNWQGLGTTARPAKGGTPMTGGNNKRPIPPLYRNPAFFTPDGEPETNFCSAMSYSPDGGPGLVMVGNPVTGTWGATTTTGGAFNFAAAPKDHAFGVRTTSQAGQFRLSIPWVYTYTYATLRNDQGAFGPGSGPGSFNTQYTVHANPVATINVKQGAAKFGGTMRMLGALTTKRCYFHNVGCSLGENNWRYEAVGAAAFTSGGVVTGGYIATYKAYPYHTALMLTSTIRVVGSRFPWTTGSVTVKATGRGPHKAVHYAHGYDNRN
ncbi:MAG: hypothetical protein IH827_07390, partial [Myxococcales bacterium]|nr:hypothetical protein [Myxococcales bacterium]